MLMLANCEFASKKIFDRDMCVTYVLIFSLLFYRPAGQKAQVSLSLSEAVLCLKEPGEQDIPQSHRLDVSTVTRQALGVFSHLLRMYLGSRQLYFLFVILICAGTLELSLFSQTFAISVLPWQLARPLLLLIQ
jgi:hypothetical protein